MLNVLMAIVDLIPVIAFLLGAIILQRDLYNKMSKGAFSVFSAGTIIVFIAGTLKALYKILKYTGVCLFEPLNSCFFPMQTVGFLLAGVGLLAMLVHNQGEYAAYSIGLPVLLLISAATNVYTGTMIFVVLMILGVILQDGCLIYIAAKRKNTLVIILLIVSFVFVLGMGYLSTKEELSDWYKEIVNIIGQGSFFMAALELRKKGLGDVDAFKSFKK